MSRCALAADIGGSGGEREKGADRTAGCSETQLAGARVGNPLTTLNANTQVISRSRLDGGCGWYTFPEFLQSLWLTPRVRPALLRGALPSGLLSSRCPDVGRRIHSSEGVCGHAFDRNKQWLSNDERARGAEAKA